MPKVVDPALLAQLNQGGGGGGPRPIVSAPVKAPTGFAPAGPGAVTPLVGGNEDPRIIARNAQITANIQGDKQAAQARLTAQLQAQQDAIKFAREQSLPKISPEVRAKALTDYVAAQRMGGTIQNLRKKFAAGPGKTSGLEGVLDFLPTEENARFDTLADTMRGDVGTLLGFTGGQLNSPEEVRRNVGPYIPNSGNFGNLFDSTSQDKITYLEGLAAAARKRAVAQLGGVPDANGNITPAKGGVIIRYDAKGNRIP